jgi:hypothetical protein
LWRRLLYEHYHTLININAAPVRRGFWYQLMLGFCWLAIRMSLFIDFSEVFSFERFEQIARTLSLSLEKLQCVVKILIQWSQLT